MVQVKGNQQDLLEHCQQIVVHRQADSTQIDCDKGHGRIEQRTTKVFHPPTKWLPKSWRSLIASVILVTRKVTKRTPKGDQNTTTETSLYVSTTKRSACQFAQAIRGHWSVENQLHYVRDVVLKEDACQAYTRPGILARMRTLALNILYHNQVASISQAIYRNTLCFDSLIALKGL